jgi:hypothetical protein
MSLYKVTKKSTYDASSTVRDLSHDTSTYKEIEITGSQVVQKSVSNNADNELKHGRRE